MSTEANEKEEEVFNYPMLPEFINLNNRLMERAEGSARPTDMVLRAFWHEFYNELLDDIDIKYQFVLDTWGSRFYEDEDRD